MKRIIYWFRNDLRLHDQPILPELTRTANTLLLPVFIFDDRWFADTEYGFTKTGPFRTQFLIETVNQLRQQLNERGSELLVLKGITEDLLADVALKFKADAIFATKEDTHEEILIEKALVERLNFPVIYHESKTLLHPKLLPFSIENLPDVFTDFRKQVEPMLRFAQLSPAIEMLPAYPDEFVQDKEFGINDFGFQQIETDQRTAIPFKGGELEGLKRMDDYVWVKQLIRTYKETRNGLTGADYSSKFSPWLANGSLSPRMIYYQILKFESEITSNESTYWMVFELLWRDYFRFVAKKFGNKIFQKPGIRNQAMHYKNDELVFEKWRTGNTGNDFVDANMRELLKTGFMSNRGRQNVASFLCKDLKIDWRRGAAWFESQLIDYDVASNWGNWMYVAGVGNDPRQDRRFDMERQASLYDPDHKFRELWLAH